MRRDKKSHLKLLLIVLLLLGLGYAFLKTDLSINGTGKIAATSWNIYFDNVRVSSGSATLQTGDQVPTINSTTLTDITYTITLKEPGDYYEFLVDVKNTGTLNAMIGSISSKMNGVEISTTNPLPAYIDYSIAYYDDIPITENQLLAANGTETIKVRIEFKTDIDPSDLPTLGATLTFDYAMNYIQADDNAQVVDRSRTVYVFTTTVLHFNEAIPSEITQYSSAEELLAENTNTYAYLKLVLENDLIRDAYVGRWIKTATDGLNPGYYYLRGGVNEFGLADTPVYNSNKLVIQSLGSNFICDESTYNYRCYCRGVDALAGRNGQVNIGPSDGTGGRWEAVISLTSGSYSFYCFYVD